MTPARFKSSTRGYFFFFIMRINNMIQKKYKYILYETISLEVNINIIS